MGSGIVWIPPLTKGVALGSEPSLAVLGFLFLKTQILVGPTWSSSGENGVAMQAKAQNSGRPSACIGER